MDFADLTLQVHSESVAIGEQALEGLAVKADAVERRANESLNRISRGMQSSMKASTDSINQGMADVETRFANSSRVIQTASQRSEADIQRQAVSAQMAMGNLTAQYNDIAVMMAAGQNPIQLALQQGTQINQVYGQLQAQGLPIMQSMIGALKNMVTPINLITIGTIAAAGAFVNWMMSGSNAAEVLEDSLKATKDAVAEYSKWTEIARREQLLLSASMTTGSQGAYQFAVSMREVNESMIRNGMTTVLRTFNDELKISTGRITEVNAAANFLGQNDFDWGNLRSIFDTGNLPVSDVVSMVQEMRIAHQIATDPNPTITLDQRIAAMERLTDLTAQLANADGQYDPESREGKLLSALAEQLQLLKEYRDTRLSSAQVADEEIAKLNTQTEIIRMGIAYGSDSVAVKMRQLEIDREAYELQLRAKNEMDPEDLARAMDAFDAQTAAKRLEVMKDVWDGIKASALDYFDTVRDRAKYITQETSELETQANIARAALVWGQESVVVKRLELQASRDTYSAMLDQRKVVGQTKDEMMSLWDTANGVASVDYTGTILEAVGQTYTWGDAMAYVSDQITGIIAGLNAITNGAISSAGNKARIDALEAGASAAEARRKGDQAERDARYKAESEAAGQAGDYGRQFELWAQYNQDNIEADEQARIAELEAIARERDRKTRGKGGKGSKGPKGFDRTVLDTQLDIATMEKQAELLEKILESGGDWERQMALLEIKQKMLNDAQMKGVEITPELEKKIDDLAKQYVDAADALDYLRERQQWFENAMQQMRGSMENAFTGLITGAHSFGDALNMVISKLAQMAAERAFNWLWSGNGAGSGGGGLLGGFVESLIGGWREEGGPVSAGTAYVVGEKRPELFVPKSDGYILPEVPDFSYMGGKKSSQVETTVVQQVVRVVPSEYFDIVVDDRASAVADGKLETYDSHLNARINKYTEDSKVRG